MGWFDQQAQQMPQQGGSLAALGGGTGRNAPIYNPVQPPQSGPQPVPGMPPRAFDGPVANVGFPGGGYGEGPGGWTGHAQDPGFGQVAQGTSSVIDPTTGLPMSQQDYQNTQNRYNELQQQTPYSQDPMKPNPANPGQAEMDVLNKRMAAWQAAPGNAPVSYLMGQGNRGSGQPINQPMGSLQSLGQPMPNYQPQNSYDALGAPGLSQGSMVNLRGPDGSTKAIPQNDLAHWLSRGAVRV